MIAYVLLRAARTARPPLQPFLSRSDRILIYLTLAIFALVPLSVGIYLIVTGK